VSDQTLNNNTSYAQAQNWPDLLTEQELVEYLRIPEISKANDYHNVIAHLKRVHDLPCIYICRQPLYPVKAIREWVEEKTFSGK
jgi:hypothetical protein